MLIEKDTQDIHALLCNHGLDKLGYHIYWYLRYPKSHKSEMIRLFPEDYDILNCPFREVPFHINHVELSVRLLAAYRLEKGR